MELRQTAVFERWIRGLTDLRARIARLAGGDKASQARDSQAAKHLARAWKGT